MLHARRSLSVFIIRRQKPAPFIVLPVSINGFTPCPQTTFRQRLLPIWNELGYLKGSAIP
ncbi:hypothetical protein AK972_4903 [Pseudomonas yamanorum]|nr:hypothetical protein AK972_4903 [Pseudomonas yamanorum]